MNHPPAPFVSIANRTGECQICDQVTTLRYRDVGSGFLLGDCCLDELRYVHQQLGRSSEFTGIRHPNPGEFSGSQL